MPYRTVRPISVRTPRTTPPRCEPSSRHSAAARAPITTADLDAPTRRLAEAGTAAERLDAAIALEASLVADYRRAVEQLSEPGILQTAATILAGHSQQHALLKKLAGRNPF